MGEALVSTLDARGAPTQVERTTIRPPNARIGPLTPAERAAVMAGDPVGQLYDHAVNRESAFERLKGRAEQTAAPTPPATAPRAAPPSRAPASRQGMGEALAKSVLRSIGSSIGSQVGRTLVRGVLGSLMRR